MYIGVDIGGSKILVAASTDGRTISKSQKIATPENGDQAIIEITHLIEQVAGTEQVKSIGISCVGPLNFKQGVLLDPPNLDWKDLAITSLLKEHFSCPVVIENDANTAALAEATIGAGEGFPSTLYVTISTGIGTGLVMDGQIDHGAHDLEGGHITIDSSANAPKCGCGGKGHFEAVISGSAIIRRFGKAAREIDPEDSQTWNEIAKDIATGLGSLITAMSPHCVVLGGGVNVHYPKFEKHLTTHLANYKLLYPMPPVKLAKNIETAAVIGALILAKQST